MICTYIRSSSYNNYDYCQLQYFINYILGYPGKVGKKTNKGTAVHKVLEILATAKKLFQQHIGLHHTPSITFYDDIAKNLTISQKTWLQPTELTNAQVQAINKSRINKYNYKYECNVPYGHIRFGIDVVEMILERVLSYYALRDEERWTPIDYSDCTNWVWMALDYKDGIFDPRRRHIVATEQGFDIEMTQDWAKYEYEHNGKKLTGNLYLKGTIDLITDINDDVYEVIDWKTGQRLDWATGKEKDFKALSQDTQLMMYYYATKKIFPYVKQVVVSIFFIRDGGPFTVCFDDNTIDEFEHRIKRRFIEIKKNKQPRMLDPLQNDFRCSKLCTFYKMDSEHPGKNFCRFIRDNITENGIDSVVSQYMHREHDFHRYTSPG